MTNRGQTTKDRILRAAYDLFYRDGFSRVSVDAIADRANLTKKTVYYHFRSKDDIAAAALEEVHRHLMPQFRDWAGPEEAGPEERVRRIFAALTDWASRDSWLGSGYSRIAAELADMPGHPARVAASAHKASVEAWLGEVLASSAKDDPAGIARQILVLIEGSMSLALIHGDPDYIRTAGDAAIQLVGENG